jgi:hypothetical protein
MRRTRTPTSELIMSWVKKALYQSGLNQVQLASRLRDMGLGTLDKAAISKLLNNERGIYADEMFAISKITRARTH